jgi:radical SAM family RiPP maturation amino acid epimerase
VTTTNPQFHALLGDLSGVPEHYISAVAQTKRFLERWTMDPSYRDRYLDDPQGAIDDLGLQLTPAQVEPLIDNAAARALTALLKEGGAPDVPESVLWYRAFIQEKVSHRGDSRTDGVPADPRLAAWRQRQINRCVSELGAHKADAIVHGPLAVELAKGCTVGCWFCGVAAPKFEHTWPYQGNEEFWRGSLHALREAIGPCARQGFLYWATDPLDNPAYESFLADFHAVLGRCPQTTTAMGQKDIERSRRILRLAASMDSVIDRFSIIALNSLYKVHEGLSPEELLRVELVPQNRESAERAPKSNAGRARRFAEKRSGELVGEDTGSTIACISGFLLNMVDKTVRLITPCNASPRWPLGYWTLETCTFDSPEGLFAAITGMIERNCRPHLRVDDPVRLRSDVRLEAEGAEIRVLTLGTRLRLGGQPDAASLAERLGGGELTVGELAALRATESQVPMTDTMSLLDQLFTQGMFDEEPTPPADALTAAEVAARRAEPVAVSIGSRG